MLGFQVDMTAVVEPQLAFDHALKQKKLKVAHECHQERLMAIGTTVAATAHEINNPIDGVITNLEYIKKLEVSCEVRNVAEESLGELKRIIRLIKAMLVFSRQEVLDKQRRICSVRCVLDEVLLITTPIIKMSSVLFTESESSVDVNHYELDVDADEVKQVLFNLITNAVQSMTAVPVAQRKLLIDCHLLADKGQVLIRVTDTGVGVPADLKKKIFEPFFTTKSEGNGTGLGLAISMQLVQNVGGILALDNDYTQGARFLLYLPICARNR
jgi:signal transduction histidine kinase